MSDKKDVVVEKLEPIPDFEAMPFEELMNTECKDDFDQFNKALWDEQSKRFEKLGIADAELLSQVDKYQDLMDARLMKLEAKFKALTKIIGSNIVNLPRISLEQYLEDKTND